MQALHSKSHDATLGRPLPQHGVACMRPTRHRNTTTSQHSVCDTHIQCSNDNILHHLRWSAASCRSNAQPARQNSMHSSHAACARLTQIKRCLR